MWNFTTIGPVGAELTHADGQTDTQTDRHRYRETDRQTDLTKLMGTFGEYPNAPQMKGYEIVILYVQCYRLSTWIRRSPF